MHRLNGESEKQKEEYQNFVEKLSRAEQSLNTTNQKKEEYGNQIKNLKLENNNLSAELKSSTDSKITLHQEIESLKMEISASKDASEKYALKLKGELKSKVSNSIEEINNKEILLSKKQNPTSCRPR